MSQTLSGVAIRPPPQAASARTAPARPGIACRDASRLAVILVGVVLLGSAEYWRKHSARSAGDAGGGAAAPLRAGAKALAAQSPKRERADVFRACLALTNYDPCSPWPKLPATPPPFAELEAHAREMWAATAPVRDLVMHEYAGYAGPWLENWWISNFSALDYSFFYPLVPLFGQWTDICCGPNKAADIPLQRVFAAETTPLRPDVMYVTVVQNDAGSPVMVQPYCELYRNVIVLSAGGWGTVPLPLIKGSTPPGWLGATGGGDAWGRRRRRYVVSFMGTLHLGRDRLKSDLADSTLPPEFWHLGTGDWRPVADESVFALAPRGFGRASFRQTELLQHGVLTLYVYTLEINLTPHLEMAQIFTDDHAWVPYQRVREPGPMWGPGGVGYALKYDELADWACAACELFEPGSVERLPQLVAAHAAAQAVGPPPPGSPQPPCACSAERWRRVLAADSEGYFTVHPTSVVAAMEERLRRDGGRYFTYPAVMEHIRDFIQDPSTSDLTCQPKPPTAGTPF